MDKNLSQIRSFLKNDLDTYKKTLVEVLSSNVFLIDNISKYIVKHKGKGLRPLLVLLSARQFGAPNENTFKVATVVELLHTASLTHDDVVDEAMVRRGFPSIKAVWKNKISVLMGDYLLAKSLIGATETGEIKIMAILAETAKRLSRGELYQIEKSRKLNIVEDEYVQMISDKTAALIGACCALGAMTVTKNEDEIDRLRLYGENLGIAFQIKDDLMDYQGDQILIGKAVGADLQEKKITLPLILAFKNAPEKEINLILKLIKKGVTKKDIEKIVQFSNEYGGLQAAQEAVFRYANNAKEQMDIFDNNPAKENALKFVDYIINRKK